MENGERWMGAMLDGEVRDERTSVMWWCGVTSKIFWQAE